VPRLRKFTGGPIRNKQISGGFKLGTGGKIGPVSQIFWKIFTKRGLTFMFDRYDIASLVKEPLALGYKLIMI
jgi:hypothetical protein